MTYKQIIETVNTEENRIAYKQDIETVIPERTTFNHTPVTMNQIMETATANVIRNIPEITAVATTASIVVGTAAGLATKGAGYAPAKAASMIIASKVLPGLMIGAEYLSALWSAKTKPEWQANMEQMTTDEVINSEMSDVKKGMIESMTLGYHVPKGEESVKRVSGNMAGSIIRDYLLIAGIPIPAAAAINAKLGKGAVNEIMLGMAMTINNGVEDYNKAINIGKSQEDAFTIMQSSFVGNGVGSIIGFGLLPRLQNALSKGVFGGTTILGKLSGGVNLAGYETTRKLTGGLIIDATERIKGKEITNDYDMTMGDGMAMFGAGLLFTAAPWGVGKLVKAVTYPIRYPAGKVAERVRENITIKSTAKGIVNKLKSTFGGSKFNGETQDFLEKDLTKGMMDTIISEISEDIEKGVNKDKAISEAFVRLPGEFTNEKNIRSVGEVFKNVY